MSFNDDCDDILEKLFKIIPTGCTILSKKPEFLEKYAS